MSPGGGEEEEGEGKNAPARILCVRLSFFEERQLCRVGFTVETDDADADADQSGASAEF